MRDATSVASKVQLDSQHHTATCFKFKRGQTSCRFGFPRPLQELTEIDSNGLIHGKRNNQWINSGNPILASCLRSNHDISLIPTKSMSLALTYYITEYATKHDLKTYQAVAIISSLWKTFTSSGKTSISGENSRLFLLKCFNKLSVERELSIVDAARTLLGYNDFYSSDIFITLNLYNLYQFIIKTFPIQGMQTYLNINNNSAMNGNYLI